VHLLFKVQGGGRQLQSRVMLLLCKFSVLASGEISVTNELSFVLYSTVVQVAMYIYAYIYMCVCMYLTPKFPCNISDGRPT
jgi:hypothetical protein